MEIIKQPLKELIEERDQLRAKNTELNAENAELRAELQKSRVALVAECAICMWRSVCRGRR